jgi:2-phospho-L-lactate guanylyltransferase
VTVSAVVPIRSFGGLTRLAHVLDDEARTGLMLRLAEHTVGAILGAGLHAVVVSSDSAVTAWGAAHAERIVPEPSVGGLDAAALAGVSAVPGPWMVVHADLPALTVGDMVAAAQLADRTTVIAPSRDGGTSLIGSNGDPQPFRYGPGSFRRHLSATRGQATILVRRGLALDLDRPWDLAALHRLGYLFGETAESEPRDL